MSKAVEEIQEVVSKLDQILSELRNETGVSVPNYDASVTATGESIVITLTPTVSVPDTPAPDETPSVEPVTPPPSVPADGEEEPKLPPAGAMEA